MAQSSFSVYLNWADFQNVKRKLAGVKGAAPKVIQMAVNRTMTGVRTDIVNEVSSVITPPKKRIRETIKIEKMTRSRERGVVTCKGEPIELVHFKARETNKGVTVQVLKKSSRSLIKHAFKATMKSGHVGVFWRKEWGGTRRPWKGKKFPYGKLPGKKGGRLTKYRGPIEKLFSLSVPQVLGNPPTMDIVLKSAKARLKKNLDQALNYELSKLRNRGR